MSAEQTGFDPQQEVSSMEDIDKLAALAAGANDDAGDDDKGAKASADSGEDAGSDDGTGDDGATPTDDGGDDQPAGIQARDRKHVLPWERFEEVQQRAEQAEADRAAMESRLAALEQQLQQASSQQDAGEQDDGSDGSSADSGSDGQQSAGELQTELSELRAEYEEIKDDDPQLARSYRASIASLERQLAMQQELDQLRDMTSGMRDAYQRQQQQAQEAAQAEIAQALQANPVTQQWMQDQSGPWMERMQQIEQQLLQVPGSKVAEAKTWDERISAVVDAVHAAYGPSPAAEAAAKAQGMADRGKGAKATQDTGEDMPPPASMAGISGEAASQGENDLSRFEQMSAAQILQHFNSLPEDQRAAQVGRLA